MKIYLASSWRNEDQPRVLAALRAAGHRVYDFRQGFSWKQVALERDDRGEVALAALAAAHAHPHAEAGFKLDFDAMRDADACVLLLPCGRSAHLEAGWFAGAGKPVHVLLDGADKRVEPELMYKFLTAMHDSVGSLLVALPDPDLGHGLKQYDRVRFNAQNGSVGEVLSKHPSIDDYFYVRWHYGLDVRGEPMTACSSFRLREVIRITDEEFDAVAKRRGFGGGQ